MDGTYPARTTTNTDHAECRGKPSHDSWLELRFIVPIEPSSVPESGIIRPNLDRLSHMGRLTVETVVEKLITDE